MYDDLIPPMNEVIKNDDKKEYYEKIFNNPNSTPEEKEEAKQKIEEAKRFERIIGKW